MSTNVHDLLQNSVTDGANRAVNSSAQSLAHSTIDAGANLQNDPSTGMRSWEHSSSSARSEAPAQSPARKSACDGMSANLGMPRTPNPTPSSGSP